MPVGFIDRSVGVFGVIAPLPADCFTLDEVAYVCSASENRGNTDDINAMNKEKRRAIGSNARGGS